MIIMKKDLTVIAMYYVEAIIIWDNYIITRVNSLTSRQSIFEHMQPDIVILSVCTGN